MTASNQNPLPSGSEAAQKDESVSNGELVYIMFNF
jgi:hypothetical protein